MEKKKFSFPEALSFDSRQRKGKPTAAGSAAHVGIRGSFYPVLTLEHPPFSLCGHVESNLPGISRRTSSVDP
jgi:hypothetical protein